MHMHYVNGIVVGDTASQWSSELTILQCSNPAILIILQCREVSYKSFSEESYLKETRSKSS